MDFPSPKVLKRDRKGTARFRGVFCSTDGTLEVRYILRIPSLILIVRTFPETSLFEVEFWRFCV